MAVEKFWVTEGNVNLGALGAILGSPIGGTIASWISLGYESGSIVIAGVTFNYSSITVGVETPSPIPVDVGIKVIEFNDGFDFNDLNGIGAYFEGFGGTGAGAMYNSAGDEFAIYGGARSDVGVGAGLSLSIAWPPIELASIVLTDQAAFTQINEKIVSLVDILIDDTYLFSGSNSLGAEDYLEALLENHNSSASGGSVSILDGLKGDLLNIANGPLMSAAQNSDFRPANMLDWWMIGLSRSVFEARRTAPTPCVEPKRR